MVKKLNLYLITTILGTVLSVMVLLLGIDLIFTMMNEVRDIGTNDYTFWTALVHFVLSMPQKIYQMFPMGALIGTLLGLGVLAGHSELIAMQASGIGVRRITRAIVLFSLGLALFTWGLGEGVAPYTDHMAQKIKARALSGGQALKTSHGTWLRDGHDFIHIRNLYVGGHREGITRYQFDANLSLKKASFASFGDYIDNHWVLKDVRETIFHENKIEKDIHESEVWESILSPSILSVVGEKYLDRLSMFGLWHTIQYRKVNGLDARPFQLAFWEKIIQPLSVGVMMFLAIPFIFGPLRSTSMGVRLVSGIIVGFIFHTFNEMFGHLSLVYRLSPALGASLPTAVFLVIGLIFIKRIKA